MSRRTISPNIAFDTERESYYVTLHHGTDSQGRRVRSVRCYSTYEQAKLVLEEFQRTKPLRGNNLPWDMTVGRWLDYWMENAIRPYRAASTCYGYQKIIDNHMCPALGRIRLQELTAVHLQQYMTAKLAEGLSPNTIRKHHTLISSALRMAVRQDMLGKNVACSVDPPPKEAPRHLYYTPEQIGQLFRTLAGTPLEPAVKLAGYLGMRRSEICGLKWDHVDLERGVIYICEARTAVGGLAVDKGPKSPSSQRHMAIGGMSDLRDLLQRMHQQYLRERLLYGLEYNPQGFVLNHRGKPYAPDYISGRFNALIDRAGLPKVTLHGLRHSFASIANSQRVSLYSICKALGHSNTTITSQIYTHLFDETHQDVVDLVGQAITHAS